MSDFASNAAATSAGYVRIQEDRGAGKIPPLRLSLREVHERRAGTIRFLAEARRPLERRSGDCRRECSCELEHLAAPQVWNWRDGKSQKPSRLRLVLYAELGW
jgi:hypothetical protein